MLNIVLVEPEIPQNTGNIARTCACFGMRLHLVAPLGFVPSERNLRRAGCDYWDKVEIVRWGCLEEFLAANADARLWLFTGRVGRTYTDAAFGEDDFLLFGRESSGLPQDLLDAHPEACLRIPMREGLRSLNLSNAVAIAAAEALRQHGFTFCSGQISHPVDGEPSL